jgi:predicted transcriptional regulator
MTREVESRRNGVYRLSDEERTAVKAGMDSARRGDFVPEEEIEQLYQLHRRLSSLRGA